MTRRWGDEWVPWSRCIASTVNCRLLQWAVSSSRNASTHEPKQRVNYRFIFLLTFFTFLLFANCTVKCLDIRSGLGYRKAVTLSKFSCIRLITSFCFFHLFRRKIRFWFGFYNIFYYTVHNAVLISEIQMQHCCMITSLSPYLFLSYCSFHEETGTPLK